MYVTDLPAVPPRLNAPVAIEATPVPMLIVASAEQPAHILVAINVNELGKVMDVSDVQVANALLAKVTSDISHPDIFIEDNDVQLAQAKPIFVKADEILQDDGSKVARLEQLLKALSKLVNLFIPQPATFNAVNEEQYIKARFKLVTLLQFHPDESIVVSL